MIRARFVNADTKIRSVTVSGHALSDDYGRDIVCASVSVLTQSIINGMIKVVGKDNKFYKIDRKTATIDILRPDVDDDVKQAQIDALLDTLYINMEDLYKQYKDFIDFCVKEEREC